jgi:hypothetical protein
MGTDGDRGTFDMEVRNYHIGARATRPQSANTLSYS